MIPMIGLPALGPPNGWPFVVYGVVNMGPVLISASEAAEWTGRPVGTIWRWASEGRIKSYRGRTKKDTRYDLRELPAWTEDGPGRTPELPVGCVAA
jgi:hypothetical protein